MKSRRKKTRSLSRKMLGQFAICLALLLLLAIVKAVCDYHGWKVSYCYEYGFHSFIVDFGEAH